MSYFLFGSIACQGEATDELAWEIVRQASEQDIYVMLWPNMCRDPQDILHKMLDEQGDRSKTYRFLITGSPLWDTSDSLISPCYYGDHGEKWKQLVLANLKRVQFWMSSVLTVESLQLVRLYMTEGYDDQFAKISTRVGDFLDVVTRVLEPHPGHVPSVRIEVAR